MFRGFILISIQRIRSWRRLAWGHFSNWTNTLAIVVPKGFLWLNTLLDTGWTMHDMRRCHHAYGMGLITYSTPPNLISQRGSGCTTWTKTGKLSRTGRDALITMVPPFIMLRSVDSMNLQNV